MPTPFQQKGCGKLKPLIFAALAIVMSGCLSELEADGCGAAELQYLLGQNGTVLETMRFSEPMRLLHFGQAMTMDFNPGRLNIQLDQKRIIARIWCG